MHELSLRGISVVQQAPVVIEYKGLKLEETLRLDLLVEGCLLIELKSVQDILPVHKAQLFSYMKLLNVPLGLLINFHEPKLTSGIHRMMLPGSSGK
ncbi:GxxExxY protein [Terrimicrobium sacchariphilum]|uniref:GxxExxY protein n=1 Tax=Terrimicrobium sacchariphilum TaxID=690879 RepID=UPI001EDC41E2